MGTHTHTHDYMHTHTLMHTHTPMQTFTHLHTHLHTHIDTQTFVLELLHNVVCLNRWLRGSAHGQNGVCHPA